MPSRTVAPIGIILMLFCLGITVGMAAHDVQWGIAAIAGGTFLCGCTWYIILSINSLKEEIKTLKKS